MSLRIDGLDVDLAGRRVLTGVELTVASGEVVALIGPNGAGKTTLLRAVLGLVPRRTGRIEVGADGRGVIGYVPQRHEFAWDFPISVEDVAMTGRVRRVGWLRRPGAPDYEAVAEALDRVRMADLARRPVGELSGGQRQRVLVARALAVRPDVLLLDEPFTGLDMPTQELLTDLFRALAESGCAVLMTTHDLVAAMQASDRLALLAGTITAAGRPDELSDPQIWLRTFGLRPGSPLLAALSLVAGAAADGSPGATKEAC